MLGWVVRFIMVAAGIIAGWFVPKDDIGYAIIQLVVVLFFMAIISVVVLYYSRWREKKKTAGQDLPPSR